MDPSLPPATDLAVRTAGLGRRFLVDAKGHGRVDVDVHIVALVGLRGPAGCSPARRS